MKCLSVHLLFFSMLLYGNSTLLAQAAQNGEALVTQMHKRFHNGPCRSYTFSQRNAHYRNDSVIRRSEWHEAVEFPDKFRISFGEMTDRNYVVFKNDSAYNYKKGTLVKARPDSNSILLLIGGMYYRSLEDVMRRLKAMHYNLSVLSGQTWEGKAVYVIGAKENDLMANQLWIDKATLKIVRIIEALNPGEMMDMRFETHQPWCNGFIETKVSFRRNGRLEQVEEYYNIKKAEGFEEK